MTVSVKLSFVITVCLCLFFAAVAQDDPKPWEKYGLSQTEWKMIQDRAIPLSKVEELLKTGISITEYLEKPWVGFNLSEKAYIEKRRSGLSAYDIELESTSDRGGWKGDNRGALQSETGSISRSGDLGLSFVLPGYQQGKAGQKWRSRIMGTLAIASLASTVYLSAAGGKAELTPVFIVLVPDMFWSMLDFKFSRKDTDGK